MTARIALALALTLLAGCDVQLATAHPVADAGPPSDGGPSDAGPRLDAAFGLMPAVDAAVPHDAHVPRDAYVAHDAAPHDAGAPRDAATPAPTPPAPTSHPAAPHLPACPHRSLLRWGLHPTASDHLRCIGIRSSDISQTIGDAPASAGYHARDGYVGGQPYTAATDIRTRGRTTAEIRRLLSHLADHGFAAWYRWPGHDGWPASEAPHIHAVFAGCRMKSVLRDQVRAWLAGRRGLSHEGAYTFWTSSAAQRALIRTIFAPFSH
jgi:hypothetical protein